MVPILNGKKVAILIEHGFEQVEMTQPKQALEQAGTQTQIVSPQHVKVKSWKHTDWGKEYPAGVNLDQARPENYDALLLPGGVMNPDHLRRNQKAQEFVRAFLMLASPSLQFAMPLGR
jgi:protease I